MAGSAPAPTFATVAARLDRAGVVWAVFAGAAATVYGASRPVADVDILVPAKESERISILFPEAIVRHDDFGSSLDTRVTGISMPGIDILAGLSRRTTRLSYHIDLDQEMASRCIRRPSAGVMAPVIPPEDNIILKAIWGRGSEQGKHDWEDVQAMLAHLPAIDWDYLRWRLNTCCSGPRRAHLLHLLIEEASSLRGG